LECSNTQKNHPNNISDCSESQQDLKNFKESLQEITNAIDDGVTLTGLDGKVLDCNESALKQLGLTRDEFIGKNVYDVVVPEDRQRAMQGALTVLETGRILNQVSVLRKNGSRFPAEISVTILYDKNKKPSSFVGVTRDITERKKIEEDLRMASTIFNLSSDSVIVADLDGNILRVNDAACKMRGYTREEMAKLKVNDLNAPQSATLLESRFRHLVEQGNAFFEAYHMRKDKSLIPVEIHASVINWENKKLIVAIHRDITERKIAEASLRDSEMLYRTLFDNSEDGFMLLEPILEKNGEACDFRFLKLNSAYERQTGARANDVIGKLASEAAPELEPEIAWISGKVLETGKSVHYEAYNRYSDKWYDSYFFSYSKSQIGILFRDITDRKKAEEALRDSEEKFQKMIEQSPVIFELYDKDGLLIQVSPAWDKLWQIPREYVVGKYNILQSKQIIETGWAELIKRAYAGETVIVEEKEFDASLEPDALGKGRKKCLSSVIYPIRNGRGEVTHIVMMHEDTTEKKLLEEQLQDRERMATIGQTAGMVGHDLRNPLQTITGEVFLAKSELASMPDGESKGCLQESIRAIEEQVGYMDKIVSDLQTFVKPVEAKLEMINLKPLITGLLAQLEISKNIRASMQVDDRLVVDADAQLLKRVLINLITNAVQAMPDGGELIVKAHSSRKGKVQIIVEDTGIGIPEEVKSKIFTPLFTTKSKGQGFGLAVCKRVIEAQHGTISFESQVGKGTKFIIDLPLGN
jgi:PAS domain S-box-containing protein